MQLSQKRKTFSEFFSPFFESRLNFEYFEKKDDMTLSTFVLPKLQTLRTWLDKCLTSPISEVPSIRNMANVPKHC